MRDEKGYVGKLKVLSVGVSYILVNKKQTFWTNFISLGYSIKCTPRKKL